LDVGLLENPDLYIPKSKSAVDPKMVAGFLKISNQNVGFGVFLKTLITIYPNQKLDNQLLMKS